MTTTPTRSRPLHAMRWRPTAAMAIATATILLSGAGWEILPASAHTELVTRAPSAGAQLVTAPSRIKLTFSDRVLPQAYTVTLINDQPGHTLTSQVDGPDLIADVPAVSPAGRWEIKSRVVAEDGHPILDNYAFTVAPQRTTPPGATAQPTPTDPPRSPTPAANQTTPNPTIARWLIAIAILGFFTVPIFAAMWGSGYARSAASPPDEPSRQPQHDESEPPGTDPETHDQSSSEP